MSDDAIEMPATYAAAVPSPMTYIVLQQMHGASSRVGPTETAFADRAEQYFFGIYSVWIDSADSEKNIGWTREF